MKNNRRGFGERLAQNVKDVFHGVGDKLSQVMKSSAKPRAGGRMSASRLDSSQTPIRSSAARNQDAVPSKPVQHSQQKFKVPFGFTHKKRFIAVLSGVVAAIMIPVLVTSAGGAGFYTSTGGTVDYAVPNHVDTISGSNGARAVTAYTQAVVRTDVAPAAEAADPEESVESTDSDSSAGVSTGKQRSASVSLSGYEREEVSPEPTEDPYMALEPGITNDDVIALQQRLMDLHYLENDEPTNYYGPQTQQAVGYFQRKHGLDVDGYAGPKTQDLLFSDEARPYTVSEGAQGADVWNIQERLSELGYPVGVTGYYGSQTADAVAYFQRMSGITDDGTVGIDTKDLLYSDTAEPAIPPPPPEPEPEPEEETSGGGESSSSGSSSGGSSSSEEQSSSSSGSSEESSSSGSSSSSSSSSDHDHDDEEEEQSSSSSSGGGSNVPSASSGSVEAFVDAACAQEGKPYVLGGKGPNTFDCSGLVYYALNASGYKIGYMTSGGWAGSGYPSISWDNLQRGDVLCFSGHVGVYLGGGMMCDASSSNGRIMIRSMGSWARNNFICGKRPLAA